MKSHDDFARERMKCGELTTPRKYAELFKGIVFCFFVLFSAIFGFLWVFPGGLVLSVINPRIFVKYMGCIQLTWNAFVTQLLKVLFNVKYSFYGEKLGNERCVVISNHTTRMDWLLMLIPIIDANRLLDMRFSLKKPLASVPGVGWSLQFLMHIFLNRNFENDKAHIAKVFDYYKCYFDNILFVLYPEGTVFWPDTKAKSDAFAEVNNLAKLNYVLQPRTTGFNFILEQCKRTGIDTIYDVTALYETRIPQDERAFFMGGMPSETHYIIKKIKVSDVTESYLHDAWRTKDNELEMFYNKGLIAEKKIENPVSSQAWLLQNLGIFFWPWLVAHNFYYFTLYWLVLVPAFLVMFYIMKRYDGDLAKFALSRV